jgi:hypothetical protein
MKQITTILLTILALGCNAQEPHLAYSVEYVDSVINNYEQRIENFQSMLDTYDASELDRIADTLSVDVSDDRIKISLIKEGHNVWIDLIDQDTIISMTYLNYTRNVNLSE